MHLSPGVRPAVCGLVVREKRTVYWRYSKQCVECGVHFKARNATAITCSQACRQRRKRRAWMNMNEKQYKAAADKAAAALVRKKRSQKVKTKR